MATPQALHLCALDTLTDGAARGFDPDGVGQDSIFLVRRGGQVYGYRDACPHVRGAPMAWRKDAYLNAERSLIVCHAHGAEFEIETGRCINGPCRGDRLFPVALRVDADGQIFLLK
ncbi:MAG: (2Fe-2S)-binding protein [Oceanospirillaceae bacterium]|nr:(2Fe-2S)-binding protein [Oceanospirillaceae bacterium]